MVVARSKGINRGLATSSQAGNRTEGRMRLAGVAACPAEGPAGGVATGTGGWARARGGIDRTLTMGHLQGVVNGDGSGREGAGQGAAPDGADQGHQQGRQ